MHHARKRPVAGWLIAALVLLAALAAAAGIYGFLRTRTHDSSGLILVENCPSGQPCGEQYRLLSSK